MLQKNGFSSFIKIMKNMFKCFFYFSTSKNIFGLKLCALKLRFK